MCKEPEVWSSFWVLCNSTAFCVHTSSTGGVLSLHRDTQSMLPFMSNEARGWCEVSWTTTDLPVLSALLWDKQLGNKLGQTLQAEIF